MTEKAKAKVIYKNMKESTEHIHLDIKVREGLQAVFVNAQLPMETVLNKNTNYLNTETAVKILIDTPQDAVGYMADYLQFEYWCRPFFGKDITKIPPDTSLVVWQKQDGSFELVYAVCASKYRCSFEGTPEGLVANLTSYFYGMNQCCDLAYIRAAGKNPYQLIEDVCAYALELLSHNCKMRTERKYPEIFEYLGWCSWDAFQIRVNTAGILEKCREFQEKNIPVRWAILDDMWAQVNGLNETEHHKVKNTCSLYSFEADSVRFPGGLGACISAIKNQYGLKVGMWHPTTGYWNGIDPKGEIAQTYPEILWETGDGRLIPKPDFESSYTFYSKFHQFLKQCGADFVKVDNQGFIRGHLRGIRPIGEMARNIHCAIEQSVNENFDGAVINCMGDAPENVWNRPCGAVTRVSDDFLPENRAWFAHHITQCSYNCYKEGSMYFGDWDMWWTDDGQAVKNSVLRAISGGPVYVSDKVGRSNRNILMPLVFEDGKILRCDKPAVPTADCLVCDPETSGKPFKIFSMANGCGILAAFNLNKENSPVCGSIGVCDIDGIDTGHSQYAVYEHFSRTASMLSPEEKFEIQLNDQDDFKLFVIVPAPDGFAPIGLCGKFISPKSIIERSGEEVKLYEHGEYAYVKDGKLHIETR